QFCFIWRSGPAWGLVDRTRGSRGVDGPREPHKERIRLERLRKTLTALYHAVWHSGLAGDRCAAASALAGGPPVGRRARHLSAGSGTAGLTAGRCADPEPAKPAARSVGEDAWRNDGWWVSGMRRSGTSPRRSRTSSLRHW